MLTPELFTKWLKAFQAFYGRTLTPDLQEIYYEAVQDFSDSEFDQISREIFKNETFFPVAGVYQKYRKNQVNLLAETLWREVIEEITRGKTSLTQCAFPPEVEEAIIKMGGLSRLAYAQTDKMPELFKEFSRQIGYSSGLIPLPALPTPRLSSGLGRLNYAQD
jgi:hypothetical protein